MTHARRRWLIIALPLVAAFAVYLAYVWLQFRSRPDDPQRLAAELGVRSGMTVAEIGAGGGAWTVEMARRVGPSGKVFSTELDADQLARIREAVSDAGLTNVQVTQGAVRATNLPDGCCDAVFMRAVYHHFTEPRALNQDIYRIVRSGGRVGIVDFEAGGLWRWYFALGPGTPEGVPANRGGHGVPMTVAIEELRAAGFTPVRSEEDWSGAHFLAVFRKP